MNWLKRSCRQYKAILAKTQLWPIDGIWNKCSLLVEDIPERIIAVYQIRNNIYIFTPSRTYLARKIRWYDRAKDRLKGLFRK